MPALAERLAGLGARSCQFLTAADTRRAVGRLHARLRLRAAGAPAARPRARLARRGRRRGFPSLATRSFAASRFEREIHDLFGLVPAVIRISGDWPCTSSGPRAITRSAATSPPRARFRSTTGQPFPFRRVEGEGHLRDHGRPGARRHHRARPLPLQRRGRDDREPRDAPGLRPQGHREALRDAAVRRGRPSWPSASRATTSVAPRPRLLPGARALAGVRRAAARGAGSASVLLELERLYNHVGDVGMIVNDTGFAFGHAHCFRLREELLRLNERAHRPPSAARRDRARRRRRSDRQADARRGRARSSGALVADFQEIARAVRSTTRWCSSGCRARAGSPRGPRARCRWSAWWRAPAGSTPMLRRDAPFAAYGELDVARRGAPQRATCGRARWCGSTRRASRRG